MKPRFEPLEELGFPQWGDPNLGGMVIKGRSEGMN
jgi:hypothetical protein